MRWGVIRYTYPTGDHRSLTSYKFVPTAIGGTTFPVDLIEFDLSDFNIILGMNWLHTYGAKIDCEELKLILKDEKGGEVFFYG